MSYRNILKWTLTPQGPLISTRSECNTELLKMLEDRGIMQLGMKPRRAVG